VSSLFAAGDAIIARLAALTGIESAQYASYITGPNALPRAFPAVFVAPDTGEISADTDEPDKVHEIQQWQIGLLVELDTAAASTASAETLAGTYAFEIIKSLSGWRPVTGYGRMRYVGRTQVIYPATSGFAELWLQFETLAVIT
jgi:hypothetical protein